jgi:hypothetical protein
MNSTNPIIENISVRFIIDEMINKLCQCWHIGLYLLSILMKKIKKNMYQKER